MRLSQLIHAMDRDDYIFVSDYDAPIDKSMLYDGIVRGIKKDNEINKMHVVNVTASDDTVCVLVNRRKEQT